IYLGFCQNQHWFATAEDAGLAMSFNQATQYAQKLEVHGQKDWKLPDQDILNLMIENKCAGAFKGTYETDAAALHYWSSSARPGHGNPLSAELAVRCVRSSVEKPRISQSMLDDMQGK